MEPVVLVCDGCGVRIRMSNPAKARERACPRCALPLAPSVDRALGTLPTLTLRDEVAPSSSAPSRRRWMTAALAILVTIGSLASLAVREASPGSPTPAIQAERTVARVPRPVPPSVDPNEPRPSLELPNETAEVDRSESVPDLTEPPGLNAKDLAILDPKARDLTTVPGPPKDARSRSNPPEVAPPPPMPDGPLKPTSPPVAARPPEPRRIAVRDKSGRAIVAREHGMLKDRMAVVLPDGQIGWPEGPVITDQPFVPATMDEMRKSLLDDPELTTFRILQTEHYLVMYQSTETFAKASADLLERLFDGLTGTLKKQGLPVKSMEFPLVAVIFATEDDFRTNRRVPIDVQAYYEIKSNRIFFYEKSKRDQDSPEVSALRKPQTVAHEGTHQILHNVGIQSRLSDWPLWLVEGLAEYCSPPKMTKKGSDWAGLGQVNPIHLATIRDLDDPLPNQFRGGPRQPIVARDRKTPMVEYLVTRKDLTPTDYALSWALTHYLVTQRPADFTAYLKRMSQLKPFEEQTPGDQLAAFREVFGDELGPMDGKIAKHLKKFKPSDALPFYAVIFEQPIGPGMIRRQAMVSQSPSVISQWLESIAAPEGGPPHRMILPQPTQKKALEVAEKWMMQGN